MKGDVKSVEKTSIIEFYSVEIENGNDNVEIVVERSAVANDFWNPIWKINYLNCPKSLKEEINEGEIIDLVSKMVQTVG